LSYFQQKATIAPHIAFVHGIASSFFARRVKIVPSISRTASFAESVAVAQSAQLVQSVYSIVGVLAALNRLSFSTFEFKRARLYEYRKRALLTGRNPT
jgi:hypothetical protein